MREERIREQHNRAEEMGEESNTPTTADQPSTSAAQNEQAPSATPEDGEQRRAREFRQRLSENYHAEIPTLSDRNLANYDNAHAHIQSLRERNHANIESHRRTLAAEAHGITDSVGDVREENPNQTQ
jgi:hypothetical protein